MSSDGQIQTLRSLAAELGHGRPAADILATALRQLIALGGLAPGTRLPTERQLAIALGTSRITIRKALHTLAEEGTIAITRGRTGGAIVQKAVAPSALLTSNELIADYQAALADSKQFRLILEPEGASLAAQHASDEEREDILRLTHEATPSLASFRAHDSELHLLIAKASRNRAIHEALQQHLASFFYWANAPFLNTNAFANFADFAEVHRELAEKVTSGDAEGARVAMEHHLHEAYDQYAQGMAYALRDGQSQEE